MSAGGEAAAAPLIGGRYQLEMLLGRGGAGEVWRARHVTLESHVAIKFLHGASADSESMRKRFLTEAKVAAQLKTRYAVHVYDFGITDEGRPYLVMELLEGETLGRRLKHTKGISAALTARFVAQAARALERAHALGIVHRDLKPENIVIVADEDGKESIKVLDFGVAKLVRALAGEVPPSSTDAPPDVPVGSLTSFTRTGSILGTPCYMPPEQILNSPDLDLRADIWALGVVAFECLTGTIPFKGETMVDLFARIQCGLHLDARAINPSLPEAFEPWFGTACAIDPAKRFATAKAAAEGLAVALGLDEPMSGTSLASSGERPAASASSSERAVRLAQTVLETPSPSHSSVPSPPSRPSAPVPPSRRSAPIPPSSRERSVPPSSSRDRTIARSGPPGRTLVTLATAEGLVIAGWRDIVVSVWRTSPTAGTAALMAQTLDAFAAPQPAGIVLVNLLEGEGAIPTDEARSMIANDIRERDRYTRAIAFVYEGEGFLAARARSITAGIVLASGRKGARSFASTTDAVTWLAQTRMLKGAQPQELLAIIEKVRSEPGAR